MLPLDDTEHLSTRLPPERLHALQTVASLHALIELGVEVEEVVVQDEFTHDIVVALGEALFAVYDST